MIDKKRGHIVGMSSMCGRTNFPLWITYSASKHGVSGMMYALNSDLNYLDLNFIKTTTIFPYLARTNQDVIKMLNTFKAKAASVSLEYLSKVAVEGILRDQNEIYIPSIAKYLLIEK
jgi:short-subunit dehydrogenase